MNFEDNCVKEADIPNDLKKLKDEYKFFRDYLLELYLKVNYSDKAIIKTPINTVVGGLLKEAIELLDGIYILSSNYSVKNVVLLLRKLFEVYLQITFILIEKDKAEEKALIFLLKNNKLIFSDDDWNHFCDDIKNKSNYLGVDISIVKNCIEKVNNNNRTYNWFNVYDNKLKRFNNVSEELDTINPNGIFDSLKNKDIYDKIYNIFSREDHGHFILSDLINNIYFFRNPMYSSSFFLLCNRFVEVISNFIIDYYLVGYENEHMLEILNNNSMNSLKKNKMFREADRILIHNLELFTEKLKKQQRKMSKSNMI